MAQTKMPWVWEDGGEYWWPGTWEVRAYPKGGVRWGQWWYSWIVGEDGNWEFFCQEFLWEWEDAETPDD